MRITYTLSEKDYLESQNLILDQSKPFKKKIRTQRNFILGIFFILVAFLLQIVSRNGWSFLSILGIAVAFVLFVSLFFLKKYTKKRTIATKLAQINEQPDLFTLERTLYITPQKIKISIKEKNTKTIQWSIIQKVMVQGDFILYFLSDTQAGILACPTMQLTPEERQHLLTILNTALPKERILFLK